MPATLPLTGSDLTKYNNVPTTPSGNPLGDIINVLNAGGGPAVLTGAPSALVFLNALGTNYLTDANFVFEGAGGRLFVGGSSAFQGSNAGLQVSSLTANRGAGRFNQYGANAGVPGVVGFKSRGLTLGSLAKVQAGDTLFRATAIGVADDNATIGLAATLGFNVPPGGVPAGQAWVATEYVMELQPVGGPANGRKMSFKVSSEGIVYLKESANSMAGVAVLGAGGSVVVPNTQVAATTRFMLTAQDGGAAPTGAQFVSARAAGVSFTIASTAGAADVGVQVYYQLFEACTP